MRSSGVDDEQNLEEGRGYRGEPGSFTNCPLGSSGSICADENMREDASIDHEAIVLTCDRSPEWEAQALDALVDLRAIEPIDASRDMRSLEELDDPRASERAAENGSMFEAYPSRLLPVSASSATLPAVRVIEEIRAAGRRGPMSRRIQG